MPLYFSEIQNENEIVSTDQEAVTETKVVPLVQEAEGPLADPSAEISSTFTIFTPKEPEETVMSKDFLNFPDAGNKDL